MKEVSIYAERGLVILEQSYIDERSEEQLGRVALTCDQLPLVIEWLNQVAAESSTE